MKEYSVKDIKQFLEKNAEIISSDESIKFNNVSELNAADKNSLIWIKSAKKDKEQIIQNTNASFIVCDKSVTIPDGGIKNKVIIKVDNPKLNFIRILEGLFIEKRIPEIHSTSSIHPEAKIGKNVFIGAFTYVGRSEISDDTVIYGQCYIYDNVKIGKKVTINAGTVIGIDGYGYERNEAGELEKFPHIGGVVIEDNVEIGANVCIDRGSLGNTIIREGAKIDNLVHVAHNVEIGKNAAVIALSMLGGSVKLGDESWIAPSVSIMNQLSIGEKSVVGMGAVVTKNVPAGEIWTGLPARPMKEFIEQQKFIKKKAEENKKETN